jgi:hypothetical protein
MTKNFQELKATWLMLNLEIIARDASLLAKKYSGAVIYNGYI